MRRKNTNDGKIERTVPVIGSHTMVHHFCDLVSHHITHEQELNINGKGGEGHFTFIRAGVEFKVINIEHPNYSKRGYALKNLSQNTIPVVVLLIDEKIKKLEDDVQSILSIEDTDPNPSFIFLISDTKYRKPIESITADMDTVYIFDPHNEIHLLSSILGNVKLRDMGKSKTLLVIGPKKHLLDFCKREIFPMGTLSSGSQREPEIMKSIETALQRGAPYILELSNIKELNRRGFVLNILHIPEKKGDITDPQRHFKHSSRQCSAVIFLVNNDTKNQKEIIAVLEEDPLYIFTMPGFRDTANILPSANARGQRLQVHENWDVETTSEIEPTIGKWLHDLSVF